MSVDFLASSQPEFFGQVPKCIFNDVNIRVFSGAAEAVMATFSYLAEELPEQWPNVIMFDSPGIDDETFLKTKYRPWISKIFDMIDDVRAADCALILLSRERKGGPFFKGVVDTFTALEHGWLPYRQIMWDKGPDYLRPRYPYQQINVLRKGNMSSQMSSPLKFKDIIRLKDVAKTQESTVSELPVEIPMQLLTLFPAKFVFDPFAGSGSTAAACLELGLPCITSELDPAQAQLIRDRLVTAMGRES